MNLRLVITLLLALVAPTVACAAESRIAESPCRLTDVQFVQALNDLHNWKRLHSFVRMYMPACPDDGMFAEGYSEVVVRTLADKWKDLPSLASIAARDKDFLKFVLRHIDATAAEADLKTVQNNARGRCPKEHLALCAKIGKEAKLALEDVR